MLHSLSKITLAFLLMVSLAFPVIVSAATSDIEPALNRIQSEISAQAALSERETELVMSRIRNQFQRMARAGVNQDPLDEVANQARQMVRQMAQNAGEHKKLHSAVSLMAQEVIKGKDPADVGEKIRQNYQQCNNLNEALSQTRAQIREQDRKEQKTQSRSNQDSSGNSGNSGSSNSGSHGSGGGGGKGK